MYKDATTNIILALMFWVGLLSDNYQYAYGNTNKICDVATSQQETRLLLLKYSIGLRRISFNYN